MLTALDIAWLIPVIPFTGACLITALFISFSRTMSRLSKPVAFVLISCSGTSAIISYFLLSQELSNELVKQLAFDWNSNLTGLTFHFEFLVDKARAEILSIISSLIVIIMIYFHYSMFRKEGYFRYFIYLSFLSGSILALPISSFPRAALTQLIS